MRMRGLPIETRLEISTMPEPNSGCVLWVSGQDKDGYGKLFYKRKHRRAHRVVFELNHGPIPLGGLICHTCDTPSCCNINHLFLGSPLSNMQDKVKKGRLNNQYMNATHCIHGHEFSVENTALYDGKRCCRICYRASHDRTRQKRRLKKQV